MIRPLGAVAAGCVLTVAAFVCLPPVAAQEASEAALKAAFVSNFAKFTDWPADARPQGGVLSLCVLGDDRVAAALEQVIKAHPGGEGMTVSRVKPNDLPRTCHVLYIDGGDPRQMAQILEAVRGLPLLTVSNASGFAEKGGVAQLFEDRGRMRFSINPAAAQRNRLSLNARLLSLAILVKDGNDAGR